MKTAYYVMFKPVIRTPYYYSKWEYFQEKLYHLLFCLLLNRDQLFKERICSHRSNFFPLRVDPISAYMLSREANWSCFPLNKWWKDIAVFSFPLTWKSLTRKASLTFENVIWPLSACELAYIFKCIHGQETHIKPIQMSTYLSWF